MTTDPVITLTRNEQYSLPSHTILDVTLRPGTTLLGLAEICKALANSGADIEDILDHLLMFRRVARYEAEQARQAEANVG